MINRLSNITDTKNYEITMRQKIKARLKAAFRNFLMSWELFRQNPLGLVGLSIIILFGIISFIHPLLMNTVWDRARYHPVVGFDLDYIPHPSNPSRDHLLGTDNFGRDVLSQLLFSAQASFIVGISSGVIAVILSTLIGSIAGYYGGWADTILMAIAGVFVLLPAPIILLLFGLLYRMEWPILALTFGFLTGLGGQAIIVKSQTLNISVKPFVEAARIAGGNNFHILITHILPGLLPLALVHAVFTVVGAVLTESLLSFFGRTIIEMSWGTMIWLGVRTFRLFTLAGQWNAITPPALAIMPFCSAFYLVGRALDQIVNPRLRNV